MADIKFTGNIGKDPELKHTNSGTAILSFSVADSKSRPDGNGGWEKLAEQWLRVAVWGELAEFYADRLQRGSRVTIWGEFMSREYEGQNGKGISLDVKAGGIEIHKPRNGQSQGAQNVAAQLGGQQQGGWGAPSGGSGGWPAPDQSQAPF